MSAVLAIDLGGTHLRAALVGADEDLRLVAEHPAPQSLDAFSSIVSGLLGEHSAARLGMGVPGLARGTTCIWIPNLGYLDGVDLSALFPGIAIGLGNDAQLALLAEATAGAARGLADAILLSIGTGIGSAVLSGGRILKGSHGGACSYGWACADPNDPGDERRGWLERHASGRALDATARSIGLDDGTTLIAAARGGSAEAIGALRQPMRVLGASLAGAVALVDPELIVVTGGVASAMDLLAPLIKAGLERQLPPHLRDVEIKSGQFGPAASLRGAAIAGVRGPAWGTIT
jgi:predicted NBD/HSP70 family sugar kinase